MWHVARAEAYDEAAVLDDNDWDIDEDTDNDEFDSYEEFESDNPADSGVTHDSQSDEPGHRD